MCCVYDLCTVTVYDALCQASTPSSPTYVAAVVEYSPETGSSEDTVADIVSKNVANYVPLIEQAAQKVQDLRPTLENSEELALKSETVVIYFTVRTANMMSDLRFSRQWL
jgi:hypothetical protein